MTVWIIEMAVLKKRGYQWEPTVGTSLSREDARKSIKQWRKNCPNDMFRLRQYTKLK